MGIVNIVIMIVLYADKFSAHDVSAFDLHQANAFWIFASVGAGLGAIVGWTRK